MKRILCGMLLLSLFLAGCAGSGEHQKSGDIVFTNQSRCPVSHVTVSCDGESQGGLNADGSPLRKGDELSFDMVKVPSVVTVYGTEGKELASCVLSAYPESQWKISLHCCEDGKMMLLAE